MLFPEGRTSAALGKGSQNPEAKLTCKEASLPTAVRRHTAMATFEEQTACVVEALFSDLLGEDESDYRSLETDSGGPVPSAGQPPTRFDPVVVASRLRQMGDQCNMDFERVSSEALTEVLMGKELPFTPPEALELPGPMQETLRSLVLAGAAGVRRAKGGRLRREWQSRRSAAQLSRQRAPGAGSSAAGSSQLRLGSRCPPRCPAVPRFAQAVVEGSSASSVPRCAGVSKELWGRLLSSWAGETNAGVDRTRGCEPGLTFYATVENAAQTAPSVLAGGEVWGCRGLSQQELE
ncbi:bcl-2-like protein 15 isoform 1-T1 [Chlamydotis macqueenii]